MTTDEMSPYGPLIDARLRVMTWNLWWRYGPWEARQPAILATIRAADPDVVALQEVWGDAGGATTASVLAGELGYHHVYVQRLDIDGVTFGNAVMSRWPIASTDHRDLPAPEHAEELRTVLRADVHGPRGTVQVFCTHLNWRFDHGHVRQEQARTVARFVADSRPRTYPPIVCGDLNAVPDSDEVRMLTGRAATPVEGLVFHDAWEAAGDGPGFTWSNANPFAAGALEPDRRIDYVLVGWPRAGGAGHVIRVELAGTAPVGGITPSDHYAVVADLRY